MRFSLRLAWRDLSASGHMLWVLFVCLMLGVALIAATGGLYRQVADGLLSDTRAYMGGDLQLEARQPLPAEVLEWMRDRGRVSLVTEVDTMLSTPSGGFQLVELQSLDQAYPLYGELALDPLQSLQTATRLQDDVWGIAVDPVLAERLKLTPGDRVGIGDLQMEVRAVIRQQPDRQLRANWRGAPVLIAEGALAASGLVRQSSRLEYEYRVRTPDDADRWKQDFFAAFPDTEWEVRTFMERSERVAQRLAQVASGLMIIGLSTLFIGGLGVFNSVQAYLQRKLGTIATLRAVGLRQGRLATVYLLQIGLLAGAACVLGALLGYLIALGGAAVAESRIPLGTVAVSGLGPALLAIIFGLVTAFTFAFPALGRALATDPAVLFRDLGHDMAATPKAWWLATAAGCVAIVGLVVLTLPDPLFALGFLGVMLLVLLLLEGVVRGLRRLAERGKALPWVRHSFTLRLALSNLRRPGSPLRTSLLSLGSAVTLLVICAILVTALIDTIANTIPEEAPALVLYDIADDQRPGVEQALRQTGAHRIDVAPMVRGRLTSVNGKLLTESADDKRREEARDEQKLTYPANNIDNVELIRGTWWDEADDAVSMVMEDREADQLGLKPGDRLTFTIAGSELQARLTGIYRQKGIQTRFWFEGIFSQGALDTHIYRHVGAAYMSDADALEVQREIARIAPNVVTVRTADLLATARDLLGKAVAGLAVVAAISLSVSLLVLTSVIAANRARQVYDAAILHALGARPGAIRQSLYREYLLLAAVTAVFATVIGAAIAIPLLEYRLKLPTEFPLWAGIVTALSVSYLTLHWGATWLLRRMKLSPAVLLRERG